MKKSFIILAAAALVLTGCSNNDVKDNIETEVPMNFQPYSENITRSTTNGNLEAYHSKFGVWAYKTVSDTKKDVMIHYEVDKQGTETVTWKYDGVGTNQYLKYWDKAASKYNFYAYAPYTSTVQLTASNTIQIASGQYAANENIQSTWATTLNTAKFSGIGAGSTSASTDWMVATPYERTPVTTDIVSLEFKHILSKVVVRIKKKDQFTPKITVKTASLSGVYGTGSYNGTAWTASGEKVNINCLSNTELPATESTDTPEEYYTLESLVIPATTTPTFNIKYTIGNDPEEFIVTNAEIKTITDFASGYNYLITVTVGPDPIEFDATVTDWDDADNSEVTVE